MSLRDLLVLQAGSETSTDTWGAGAKTPTVKLMGVDPGTQITPMVETQPIEMLSGSLAPAY